MAIGDLLKIIPPPAEPVDANNGDTWKRAQEAIGITLPSDFRDIGIHYGNGTFCGFIGVINPLAPLFESSVGYLLTVTRETKRISKYPYEVFPNQPGLLPWGGDEHAHHFHWLTEGDAESWPVIIESHEGDLERFDMSLTTFLAKALINEIRPKYIWGQPFTAEDLVFHPDSRKLPKKKRRKK